MTWNFDEGLHKLMIKYIRYLNENIIEPLHDKTNKVAVRLAKTQITLGIRSVWSVFALRLMGS